MTIKGTMGTTNARSEEAYKCLTVDEKKQRARDKKSAAQRARRKRKLDEEAAGDAAGAAGDAADELEKEEGPIEDPPARDERRQSDSVPDPSEPGDESDFDEDPIGEAGDEDQDEQLTQDSSADDIDTDMELVGPAAAVEPVVGPAAVVDPASLDTFDDEDVLSAIAVIISRSVFWGAL